MEEKYCEDCKYFRQHYITDGTRYDYVYCGHCVYPRLKTRKPDTPACFYFVQREKDAGS